MLSDNILWFWFAFPWWLVMLSTFSRICQPTICLHIPAGHLYEWKEKIFSFLFEFQGGNLSPVNPENLSWSSFSNIINGTDVWASRKYPFLELKHIWVRKYNFCSLFLGMLFFLGTLKIDYNSVTLERPKSGPPPQACSLVLPLLEGEGLKQEATFIVETR